MSIFILLILLSLAYPLVKYGTFFVSSRRAGSLPVIRERLGGLAWPVLRAMGTALAAGCVVCLTYPLGLLRGRESSGSGAPVILVHGLFHNSSAWLMMKRRLREAGIKNLHTYQYNCYWGEFSDAVEGLQRKIDSLLQQSEKGKVILIGHSLGGLVIRAAVGNPRFEGKISAIVALGTPHGGSDLARFAVNPMGRGLVPGGEIMARADLVPEPDCPKLAIYNVVDDLVFPLQVLIPPEGWREAECAPMGHVWMLYSREVGGMVVDFLKEIEAEDG